MKPIYRLILSLLAVNLALGTYAAGDGKNEFNPIETGVTSLSIAPDARGASMGDLRGYRPRCQLTVLEPSKYAFAWSQAAVSLNYTPWLRKLVNDIFLADLSGYYKVGSGDNQAVSASLRYFSLGEVNTSEEQGIVGQTLNPYEMSFDVGYSRKLSEKFSMGVVFRYIYSALGFSDSYAGDQNTGASAFAADIAGYYTTYPIIGRNECQWSWGWNISNIGTKSIVRRWRKPRIPAYQPQDRHFIHVPLADYHTLAIGLRPQQAARAGQTPPQRLCRRHRGRRRIHHQTRRLAQYVAHHRHIQIIQRRPGGMKEELREITWSLGAEYSYNNQFFLRAGYYYESQYKGNRQYFGLGAGFSLNVVRLDASYMMATAQTSPLDQTLRFYSLRHGRSPRSPRQAPLTTD